MKLIGCDNKEMKECRGCHIDQENVAYGKIWLSDDGYCSVCNAKYRDRPRIKSIFEFTLKDIEYKNRDIEGKLIRTKSRAVRADPKFSKLKLMHKSIEYYKIMNKGKREITEFL